MRRGSAFVLCAPELGSNAGHMLYDRIRIALGIPLDLPKAVAVLCWLYIDFGWPEPIG